MMESKDSQRESSVDSNSALNLARRTSYKALSKNKVQLRLSDTDLHGRDDEIKLLRDKFRDVAEDKDSDEDEKSEANFILVTGKSGTGKSALINKGIGESASEYGYILAKGKFDEKLRKPLSAFSDAMATLCRHIQNDESTAAKVREDIHQTFGGERLEQLRHVLPGCVELLFGPPTTDKRRKSRAALPPLAEDVSQSELEKDDISLSSNGSSRNRSSAMIGKEAVSRTQYAVRRLLKTICAHLKGVVLFIDDLQWSDIATLDLLRNILLDREIQNLLIVGACREFEVTDNLPLTSYINDLQQMDVSITQINVGNLDVNTVASFVAEALGMDEDDSKIETLADIIHQKTEGNPLFMSTFLTSLYDDKILTYDTDTFEWTWDDDQVESKIVGENVVSVLVNKINRMKEETKMMLMVGACLGASFKVSAVIQVLANLSDGDLRSSSFRSSSSSLQFISEEDEWGSFVSQDGSYSTFASSIVESEVEGLLETDDNENFSFVHDQIQAAAFDLIFPDQRDNFRRKIGSILLKSLPPEELETNFFEVVGLLNYAASHLTDDESSQLAELNLKAGAKASDHGAFDTAKKYYEAGRAVLGSKGWERNFSTMLDLCSYGANACYLTGDFETMNEMIDEVLGKYIDATDKYRVTEVKVKSLFAQDKLNESIDVALDFRRQLGLPTLKRKRVSMIATLREYVRVMRLLKNMTVDDILDLPELEDERYEMGQRMNELLGPSLYMVEPTMAPLLVFDMVTITLKHGLNPTSSYALATLGLILCGYFDKLGQGREMARAAELMLKLPGMRRITSNTIFIVQTFCYHWTSPLQDTIAPLLKGCEEGLAIGDTESACFCLLARCFNLFFSGRSLDSVQEEVEASIDIMTQLKQDEQRSQSQILEITVKKLRRVATTDDDQKMDAIMEAASLSGDSNKASYVITFKLEMSVLMQEWEEALETLHQAIDVREATKSAFASVRFTFLEALTYLKAAQSSSGFRRMKMKKSGKKSMKLLQGWAKRGNVNVVHYLHVLEAEVAFLEGKIKKTEESFKAAITESRIHGFLHDRGLTHELASTFHEAQGDAYWSNYHIDCAMTCYKEWGCIRKIDQLNVAK